MEKLINPIGHKLAIKQELLTIFVDNFQLVMFNSE